MGVRVVGQARAAAARQFLCAVVSVQGHEAAKGKLRWCWGAPYAVTNCVLCCVLCKLSCMWLGCFPCGSRFGLLKQHG